MTLDDILAAGRAIGMRELSVVAVAQRLGVTPTALYRHVGNRWGLERLVGESMIADLPVPDDDPLDDLETSLLRLALALHRFALARPGLAAYLLTLFPRGDSGLQLLASSTRRLVRHGLDPDVALVAANAVASFAFALTAAQEQHGSTATGDVDLDVEIHGAARRFAEDPRFVDAVHELPPVTGTEYVQLLLATCVRGVVASIPPAGGAVAVVTRLGERLGRAGSPLAATSSPATTES